MNKEQLVATLLLLFCGHSSGFDYGRCHETVYVSKNKGTIIDSCGTKLHPCKTLEQGVSKLCWNGKMMIDGEATKQTPYSCGRARRLVIQKSLNLVSYNQRAAILCLHGIVFKSLEATNTSVLVQGVTFVRTTIRFYDATAVFDDCMFTKSLSALRIQVSKQISSYSLNISNSIFKSNLGCVHINSKNGNCNAVSVSLINVTFLENSILRCGLIKTYSSLSKCGETASLTVKIQKLDVLHSNLKDRRCNETKFPINGSFIVASGYKLLLKFEQVNSSNNTIRFLGIRSRQASITVNNSKFYGHQIIDNEGGIFLITGPSKGFSSINLSINGSKFANNAAFHGAVLSIKFKKLVFLIVSNVDLKNCYSYKGGCLVSVKRANSVHALISYARLVGCHSPIVDPAAIRYFRHAAFCIQTALENCVNRDTIIRVVNSLFSNNKNGSVFFISHATSTNNSLRGILDVSIVDSKFDGNADLSENGGAAVIIKVTKTSKHTTSKTIAAITHSSFHDNKGGIILENVDEINVRNISFINNTLFCIKALYDPRRVREALNTTIKVIQSKFIGNEMPFIFRNKHPEVVKILLQNLIFHGNDRIISINLDSSMHRGQQMLASGIVELDKIYFASNSLQNSEGYLLAIHSSHRGSIAFKIGRSIFKDNYQNPGIGRSVVSLLYFFMPEDAALTNNRCPYATLSPCYRYNNSISFEDVTFTNNTGSLSLLYLSCGRYTFTRCLFRNNFSRQPTISAQIYVEDQSSSSLKIENSSFIQEDNNHSTLHVQFLYEGSRGPLELINSKFESKMITRLHIPLLIIQNGGFVSFDNTTNLLCPRGSFMKFVNLSRIVGKRNYSVNITRFIFTCVMCAKDTYSLERGAFLGSTLKTLTTRCLPCPNGANCTMNIKTTDGFWGYVKSHRNHELSFTRCPQKYCKVPSKSIASYNGCYGNREGTMCGACREGFTESLFNRKCRLEKECNDRSFWVITGVYSTIIALYFIVRPNLSEVLMKRAFWFVKKRVVPPNSRFLNGRTHSGFSKIVFYFYQVTDLLQVRDHDDILDKTTILSSIVSIFTFEIERFDQSSGCPFPGISAVTKELLRCVHVIAAMVLVLLFYLLLWLVAIFRNRIRPYSAPYIAAIIEILMLGYERIGHTSMELLHCSPLKIDGHTNWHLFIDGNVMCWIHWWQFALVVYNGVFVIPFMVVLWVGTAKLRRKEIGPWRFVFACFMPLPFLLVWLFQYLLRRPRQDVSEYDHRDQETTESLLDVIEGPFRTPTQNSSGALYWDSILICRRLVFLCLYTFIISPILRMFLMSITCVVILVHNALVLPYKERKSNFLALALLFVHVFMATSNLCLLVNNELVVKATMSKFVDILRTINFSLIAFLPLIFALLVTVALASHLLYFGTMVISRLRSCLMIQSFSSDEHLVFVKYDDGESNDES